MAKNSVLPTGGGSKLPKVIGVLVTLAILMMVIRYPGESASAAQGALGMIGGAVDGLASFFRQFTA